MKSIDKDIRKLLHSKLEKEYLDGRVVHELSLSNGNAIIDIAVIDELMHGYEIKSAKDTLVRLPNQINYYNQVFDKLTLVVDSSHIDKALEIIPDFWGVIECIEREGNLELIEIRKSKLNEHINPYMLSQLLWKQESLNILKEKELHKGVLSKTRKYIWARMAETIPIEELRRVVTNQLKNRPNWRDKNGKAKKSRRRRKRIR